MTPSVSFSGFTVDATVSEPPLDVALDASGRFWITSEGYLPRIYSRNGTYLRSVGREGGGPGEFRFPTTLARLPGDSMLVLDLDLRRAMVIDSAGRVVRSVATTDQLLFPIPNRWPDEVVVSARIATPAAAGFPLHIVSFTGREVSVKRSFGSLPSAMTPRNALTSYSVVAADGLEGYVASNPVRYAIERWSKKDNQLLQVLKRDAPWFGEVSTGRIGNHDTQPEPVIRALFVDKQGLIWVFVSVAAERWREQWKDVPRNVQEVSSRSLDRSRLLQTRIEVLDPKGTSVVARGSFPGVMVSSFSDGRVAAWQPTLNGEAQLRVLNLELKR